MSCATILLVDDSDPFRRFVCRALQRPEFDVIQAADGGEALKKAEEFRPDLILLDIGLPGLNGIEAARQIQTLCPESKIVFLSLESLPEVVAVALGLRPQGFIYKLRAYSYLLPAIEATLEGTQCFSGAELGRGIKGQAPHRHEAHFYSDDSVLLESLDHFIAGALMAKNAAIVLATKPHREALAQHLKQGGVDIDGAIQRGTYISLDAADVLSTIMVNGTPDCDLFLERLGGPIESAARATKQEQPRVAIFGELVALLHAEGELPAAIRIEQSGNDFLRKHCTPRLDIMCGYPSLPFAKDPDSAFKSVCTAHSAFCIR